jgi:hypothetical protein
MKEPDGAGSGCMLYPFGGDEGCPTQPLVTISNVSLKNIEINGGLTPGIVRCDEANKCLGFEFENVKYKVASWLTTIEGWLGFDGWICENVYGTESGVEPGECLME